MSKAGIQGDRNETDFSIRGCFSDTVDIVMKEGKEMGGRGAVKSEVKSEAGLCTGKG